MRTRSLAILALAVAGAGCHPALVGGAIAAGGGGGGGGDGPGPPPAVVISSFPSHIAPGDPIAAMLALTGKDVQLTFELDYDGDPTTDPSFPLNTAPIVRSGGSVVQVSLTLPDTIAPDQYYLTCSAANAQGDAAAVTPCRITVSRALPARDLVWRNAHAATGVHRVLDSAAMPDGDLCVVGWWSGDLYGEGSTGFERCKGLAGLYVAIHDADTGAVVNQGRFSSVDAEIYARGVTALPDGSVVVVGEFRGLAFFGLNRSGLPVSRQSRMVNNSATIDGFVARYVRLGDEVRVESWTHLSSDGDVRTLGVDFMPDTPGPDLAITGQFAATLQLGPSVSLTSRGTSDVFLLRMTPAGQTLWAVRGGGDQPMTVEAGTSVSSNRVQIGLRPGIQIAITGQVWDTDADDITFTNADGSVPANGRLTGRSDAPDVFTAVYHDDGTLKWLARGGGDGEDLGRRVVLSVNSGSVYVVGDFRGTASFDGSVGPGMDLTSLAAAVTEPNGFVIKYDQAGSVRWAQRVGSTLASSAIDVTLFNEPDNAVGVCGWFLGDASIRLAGDDHDIALRSYGGSDMFAARLQVPNGAPVDARNIGGAGFDLGYTMQALGDLSHFVAGEFASTSVACGTLAPVRLEPANTRSGALVMKVKQP